jgi:membrane-associated phospholipid phosphatase
MVRPILAALFFLIVALPAPDATATDGLDFSAPEARRSVYRITPAIDIPLILAGAAGVVLPYAFSSPLITRTCPCDERSVNGFDRFVIGNHSNLAGLISDATVGLSLAVPVMLALGTASDYPTLVEDLTVFVEALSITGALVSITKVAISRPLPRVYEGDRALLGSARGYRSFYSGHTTFAFAAMATTSVTIGLRYDRTLVPWLVTGLVGTSVAVERLLGGYHFPSDVIVGALVGTAVGVAVPLLHARRPLFRMAVLPSAGGMMLSVVGSSR